MTEATIPPDLTGPKKAPLPEGIFPVGIGIFISGITSYAFFKVGQLALGKEDFKPLVALWFITFALVPGFLIPVEQEIGRALAHRRALLQGGHPVIRKMVPLAFGLAALLVVRGLLACHHRTHLHDHCVCAHASLPRDCFGNGTLRCLRHHHGC